MAWVRSGDTATLHPVFLAGAIVEGADDRTRDELYSVAIQLAQKSTAHGTDSVIGYPTLLDTVGRGRVDRLARQLIEAGYLTPLAVDGHPAWKLINDPKFIHIRHKAEVAIDAARKAEARDGTVRRAVQLRDGSRCRYCGRTVDWNDATGGRLGTLDHRDPAKLGNGKPITSAAEAVVACRTCNSRRGVAYRDGRLAEWDQEHPLRPVPEPPHYDDYLRGVLTDAGLLADDPVPAPVERPAPDTATTDLRPGSQPESAIGGLRPGTDTAPDATVRPEAPQLDADRPDPPGGRRRAPAAAAAKGGHQGRDGQGRAGPGAAPRRRRSRRRRPGGT